VRPHLAGSAGARARLACASTLKGIHLIFKLACIARSIRAGALKAGGTPALPAGRAKVEAAAVKFHGRRRLYL